MMEFRHLRYFVVLAEELHFGHAAQRLHIAQPGLSQQIHALESQLGVSLLIRTHRRVELTAAGTVLLEEGRRALAQFDRAESLTRRAGSGEIGRLTIGSTESTAFDLLPQLVREYRHRYPNVELVVREMPSATQIAALRTSDIDVGVVLTPVDTEGLALRTIRRENIGVLLPDSHPLASHRVLPLTALKGEPFILYPSTPRPGWADFLIRICRNAGFEPSVAQETFRPSTAASFVAAGLGLTLVPESLRRLVRPGVTYRPLMEPAPITENCLVHRVDIFSPTVAALLKVAQQIWPDPNRRVASAATGRR